MPRTLSEIDAAVAALEARVNAIDGTNLPDPKLARLTKLQATSAGLKTTLNQTALAIQASLNDVKKSLAEVKLLIQNHLSGG